MSTVHKSHYSFADSACVAFAIFSPRVTVPLVSGMDVDEDGEPTFDRELFNSLRDVRVLGKEQFSTLSLGQVFSPRDSEGGIEKKLIDDDSRSGQIGSALSLGAKTGVSGFIHLNLSF